MTLPPRVVVFLSAEEVIWISTALTLLVENYEHPRMPSPEVLLETAMDMI